MSDEMIIRHGSLRRMSFSRCLMCAKRNYQGKRLHSLVSMDGVTVNGCVTGRRHVKVPEPNLYATA